MGHALKISDPETCRMVAELARHRGISMTQAVHDTIAKALSDIEANADARIDDWLERMSQVRDSSGFQVELDRSQWPDKEI